MIAQAGRVEGPDQPRDQETVEPSVNRPVLERHDIEAQMLAGPAQGQRSRARGKGRQAVDARDAPEPQFRIEIRVQQRQRMRNPMAKQTGPAGKAAIVRQHRHVLVPIMNLYQRIAGPDRGAIGQDGGSDRRLHRDAKDAIPIVGVFLDALAEAQDGIDPANRPCEVEIAHRRKPPGTILASDLTRGQQWIRFRQLFNPRFTNGPSAMAKSNTVLIKLISTADTGYYYVTKKNPRAKTEKMELKKYDPVVRKHVAFKEGKIK